MFPTTDGKQGSLKWWGIFGVALGLFFVSGSKLYGSYSVTASRANCDELNTQTVLENCITFQYPIDVML